MKMPNNQLYYMEEPKLKFAFNQSAEDSRDGLTLFGPYEKIVVQFVLALFVLKKDWNIIALCMPNE